MSQAKIDQYKKEKANRKANVKKEKVKKKITAISLSVAGVLLVAFLVWGVVATVKDGGLNKIKEQQNQDLVTQELINNLCDNAIRYNDKNGSVLVRVRKNEESVILSVKDNGIGIPKEHQERIFERFYRVDKSRSKETGGTGLGLAIVKHIVALHDAKIEVNSEVGKGSEISVTFPRVL